VFVAEEGRLAGKLQAGAEDVYFLRQTIGNACGTIAMLHAVGNNLTDIRLGDHPLSCTEILSFLSGSCWRLLVYWACFNISESLSARMAECVILLLDAAVMIAAVEPCYVWNR
jgi:Ubiquitin carboxyl-terminal hydrolase, family 1